MTSARSGITVRAALTAYVDQDVRAALVATDPYAYSDQWHYDLAGYIELGRRFAEAMVSLLE